VLLDYLRQCVIGDGWRIPPTALEWLQANLGIAATMDEFVKASRDHFGNAEARLRIYEPLLQGGDPNNGQQVFLGKGACSTCHRVGKSGGIIGPDLTKIGAIRSGRDLIESLAMPSATFAQGYESYRVKIKDGEALTGMRVRTIDDSFVLRDASGAERRVKQNEIETTDRLETSAMPDGLLTALSETEIRDLLAYLQSLK
jgi:putative heme-binding domain-containing protein